MKGSNCFYLELTRFVDRFDLSPFVRGSQGKNVRLFFACFLLSATIVIAATNPATAQVDYGSISLFSDPNGDSCVLIDDGDGPLNIYVVQKTPLVRGWVDSRFRVSNSEGFNADYVGEVIHAFAHVGDLRAGIEIVYGHCDTGTVLLLATMTYMGHGDSSPCAYLEVLPHPQSYSGGIDLMDCNFDTYKGSTLGPLLVNPTSGTCSSWCTPVSVESSTWGAVKALYR